MCTRRGWSYERLLTRAADLRAELEQLIPAYTAAVRKLSRKPEEFDRKGCASWVDALVNRVRADHQRWEVARQRVGLISMLATAAANIALMAVRYQPVPPPANPVVVVAILPDGKLRPALASEFAGRGDVALLTWREFEATARKVKEQVLRGEARISGEDEIPALIRRLALAPPKPSA